jgi:phenylalanyl-tRNA synthetase alpha chain
MSQAAASSAPSTDLLSLKSEILSSVASSDTIAVLEEIRVSVLGKKGRLTEQMKTLGTLPPEERKNFGAALNVMKEEITTAIEARHQFLTSAALGEKLVNESVDVTLSSRPQPEGRIHPITQTIEEIITAFASMGFSVASGPDIESDYYNFQALNIPAAHPARQMQDTFYMPSKDNQQMVLRTHTSPVQIRTMMEQKPPIRIISPGRCYRFENDMTHAPMFHQFEALVIDENTHMGHLKGCVMDFLRAFFGISDLPVRFRPSYFPFTEPSAEIDIGCKRGGGELKLGNYGDWLEIGGSGMVHPNVLKNCGIDPEKYQGFAFGWGIERIAMLKYGIPDVRNFFEADLRWLKHYGFLPLDIPNPALKA